MVKISLLPDKNEKRAGSFDAVVTDVKVEVRSSRDGGLNTFFTVEFGEEAPLSVNMRLENWVKTNDGFSPKPPSSIYKLLASFQRAGVGIDFDINKVREAALVGFTPGEYAVKTDPSILGKACSFNAQEKSFVSDAEIDDTTGEAKVVKFCVWTLKSVKGATLDNFSEEKQKAPVTQQPVEQVVSAPADMDTVTKNWLEIISALPELFKFPEIMAAKAKFIEGKNFSAEEMKYYINANQVRAMVDLLVAEGYLIRNKMEFSKNNEKILEKLI